jgi:arabinosaccharide transport system permease protein
MSFQNIQPGIKTWVGFSNYAKLLKDSAFHTAIGNSFLYMILTLVLLIPFPMFFACIMNSKFMKFKGFYKGILYLPALTSVVVAGTIFRLMFSELDGSAMNQLMHFFGGKSIKWLMAKPTGFVALLTLCCWRWTGVNMLYFMAGLNTIDVSLYESAEIDGATRWQTFRKITFPLLRPTTIYVLTISIYAGLAMFLESYMLWNGNSSPKNIGLTIVGYLYRRGIEKNQLGYASAVGLVLLVLALIINTVQLVLSGTFKKENT